MVFDGDAGLFILFSGLGVIAWKDWRKKMILNRELILLFAARGFLLFLSCMGTGGTEDVLSCVQGFFLGGGVFFFFYVIFHGRLGAGDVKLFAVLGWWLGSGRILQAVFLTAFLAACRCALALVVCGKASDKGIALAPFAWFGTLGAYFWKI